eukprot:TRINITY_DN3232_c0_g1_i12.p1 TRINITY_DN3232_c0_g1~~TRINITY_DN3232_c0_g1_i12.p1  ORF type:complete len:326 (-),score=80.63 TRINITY_DN3232_c0_g1_i12:17-994(-)
MSRAKDSTILVMPLDLGGDAFDVAVKDCLDIAGFPTVCGSAAFEHAPAATENADVVNALLNSGCHIVGKTVMHELAYGMTGINAFSGTPVNPRFPDLIVGGSSSGSAAAVAAEMVDFAIGTDTGGSIRLPAACCGVMGLKPSFGIVSRQGASPVHSSLDCVGPIARDMNMIEAAMRIICPGFEPTEMPQRPTIGRILCAADAEVEQAIDKAIAPLDASLIAVELPSLHAAHLAGITIMAAEMAALFGHLIGSGKLGTDVDARLTAAKTITRGQVEEAEGVRAGFTQEVDGILGHCDAILLPTLPAEIGRAVQQECRDRSRMPSSA